MVATRNNSKKNTKNKKAASGGSGGGGGGNNNNNNDNDSNRKKTAGRCNGNTNKKKPPPKQQQQQQPQQVTAALAASATAVAVRRTGETTNVMQRLPPEAKDALLKAAWSAKRSSTGTMNPILVQRAMAETGLTQHDIEREAANIARDGRRVSRRMLLDVEEFLQQQQQHNNRMKLRQMEQLEQAACHHCDGTEQVGAVAVAVAVAVAAGQRRSPTTTRSSSPSSSLSSTNSPSSGPSLQDIPRDIWCSTLIFYLDFHTDIPNLLKVFNRKLYNLIDHEDIYKSFAQRMYPSPCLPLVVAKTPPQNEVEESNEDDGDDDGDDDRKLPAVSLQAPTTSQSLQDLLPSQQRTQLVPENYESWKECTMDHNSQNAVLVRRLVDRGFQARRRYKVLLRSTLMLDSKDNVVICKLEVDHELKRPLNQRGRSALIRTTYDALKHTKVVRTKTFQKPVIREYYTETNLSDPKEGTQGNENTSSGSDQNEGMLVESRTKKRKRSKNDHSELAPSSEASSGGLWSCRRCSLRNDESRSSCRMCRATRSSRNQRRRLQQQQPEQQPQREEDQGNERPSRSTSRTASMNAAAGREVPQGSVGAASLKAPPVSCSTTTSSSSPTNDGGPHPRENMIASRTRSKVSSSLASASTSRRQQRRKRKVTIEEQVVSTELKPIHKYLETLEQSSTSVRHVFLLVFKSTDFLPDSDYTLDYPFGRSPKVWLEKAQYQGPSLRHDLFCLSSAPSPRQQQQQQQNQISLSLPTRWSDDRHFRTHLRPEEHPNHNIVAGQESVAQQQQQQVEALAPDADNTHRSRNGHVSIGQNNNNINDNANDNDNNNASTSNTNRLSLALSAVHNTGGRNAIMLPRDGTLHKSWRTRYLRGLRAEDDDDDDSMMPDLEPVNDEEEDLNDDRSDVAVVHRHAADDVGDAAARAAAAQRQRERRPAAINLPRRAAAAIRQRRRQRRRQEQDAVGHVIAGVLGVAAAAAADAGDAEPQRGAGAGADGGRLINAENAAVVPERGADNAIADGAVGRGEQAGVRIRPRLVAMNRAINAGGRIAAAVAEAAGIAQPPQRQPSQQGGGRTEGNDANEDNPNDDDDHNGDMVRYVVSSRLPPLRPLLHIGRGDEGARLFHVEPPPPSSRVEQPQQVAAAAGAGNVRDNVRDNAGGLQLHGGGDARETNDLSNSVLDTYSVNENESMDEHIMQPLGGGRIRVQRFAVQPDVHNFFRRAAAAAAGGNAVQPVGAGGAAGHVAPNNPPPVGAALAGDADDGNNVNRNDGANLNNAGRRGARRMLLRIQLGQGGVAAIAADDGIRMGGQGNDQQEQAGQRGDAQADHVVALPRERNGAAGWRQPGDDGVDLMIPGALGGPLLIRAGNRANNQASAAANRNNSNRPRRGQNRQDEVGARILRNLPARAAARGARRRVARILGVPMAEARETALQSLQRFQRGAAQNGTETSVGGTNQESLQGLGVNPGRSDRDERALRRSLRNRRVELERRRDEQRERIREIEQNVERERQRNRRLRARLAELQAQVRVLEEFRNGRGDQDPQQQQQQQQNPPPPPPPPF